MCKTEQANQMYVGHNNHIIVLYLLSIIIIITVCHCILKDDNVQAQQAEKGSSHTRKKNTQEATWNIEHIIFYAIIALNKHRI